MSRKLKFIKKYINKPPSKKSTNENDMPEKNVMKGMLTLAAGSGIARLIGIAAIPLITRLYDPSNFGVLALYSAAIGILSPLITLKYSQAIPLPKKDGAALNLVLLSFTIIILNVSLFSAAILVFGKVLFTSLSIDNLYPWRGFLAIGLLATGVFETLSYCVTRQRMYSTLSLSSIWQSATGSLVKITLGIMGAGNSGLIIGQIFSQSGGLFFLLRSIKKTLNKDRRHLKIKTIRKVAYRYKQFPFYRVPSQLLLMFSAQAPIIFVSLSYGADITGQLSLALMALAIPINLFGQTMARSFYAEASKYGSKNPKPIYLLLVNILKKLAIFALPLTLLLFFSSKIAFPIIFGSTWVLAGELASILSIYIFFQFLQTPVSHTFLIFDGQRLLLFLNIQRIILIAIVFSISKIFLLNIHVALTLYSSLMSLHYLLSIMYTLSYARNRS